MTLMVKIKVSNRNSSVWVWALLLALGAGTQILADPLWVPVELVASSQSQQEVQDSTGSSEGEPDPDLESAEATVNEELADESSVPHTKSGYEQAPRGSGPTSVEADLAADDEFKRPVFTFLQWATAPLYDFKDRINGRWGLAIGVDYNFLNQFASFSFTEDQATSGTFRVYGTWDLFQLQEKIDGRLVFRVENRHTIGGGITPRDLGFDAGSALSTASFKDFAWGITSVYWKQFLDKERKYAFVFGQMDPGDFMDAFPLLSAWTAFMSDAFFNNPAEALPQQGVGLVGRAFFSKHYYISGGVHDALADADGVDVGELFDGEDLFYWGEVGWAPKTTSAPGDSIHLTFWMQDELIENETEKSHGVALSIAPQLYERYLPFVRIGYSDGDAALMRWIYALGVGYQMRESDLFGIAGSWGAPVDQEADPQMTSEIFYRIQMTEHLQVTPAVQMTRNPSFNDEVKNLWVGSVLRMRVAF